MKLISFPEQLLLPRSLIQQTLGCRPVAHIDSFTADKLGSAELVEEVDIEGKKITKITGVANPSNTITLLLRGSNRLV